MNAFTKALLKWHHQNPRPLPWSDGTRNPYQIWLSEIIMQQTRVEQGTGYYLKFIRQYPTIQHLAAAPLDEVMRLWEGLGYYTRARNMHKAANHIIDNMSGQFPDTYESLLSLPGVGPYSAAAISSFVFGHAHVVVDGNVKRLIARYAGVTDSVDDTKTHSHIHRLASGLMADVAPDVFNQAIMNFGALVCKPVPLCKECPLSKQCYANKHGLVSTLPLRKKKKELHERFLHFVVLQHKDSLLLSKRTRKDIWQGLYSFPHIEKDSVRSPGKEQLFSFAAAHAGNHIVQEKKTSVVYKQVLSHQLITGRFHLYRVTKRQKKDLQDHVWIPVSTVEQYGKPGIIVQYLKDTLDMRAEQRVTTF